MNDKKYYEITERFVVIEKIRIAKLLANFEKFDQFFWLECENEDPIPIARSRSYLETEMSKNKKVWILDYDSDLRAFTDG